MVREWTGTILPVTGLHSATREAELGQALVFLNVMERKQTCDERSVSAALPSPPKYLLH